MEAEKATAADFRRAETDFVLPVPQNGKALSVRLRSIDAETVLAALKGIPSLLPGTEPAAERDPADEFRLVKACAAQGIVSPVFSFGPDEEEGLAWWGAVHPTNRAAIATEIMRLSGIGAGGGPLGTFPSDTGGEAAGAGAGRTVEASAVRERTPIEA